MRVSLGRLAGPIVITMDRKLKRKAGLTLTELLCVIAILLILAAMYLPAIARACQRIRAFVADLS